MDELIEIGRIVKSIGLRGRVKAVSYCESTRTLETLKEVFIGQQKDHATLFTVHNIAIKGKGGSFLLELDGVESIDASNAINGCYLYIPSGSLEALPEGEYYWHEIIGLDVVTVDGHKLGQVVSIVPTGSNDVYVCAGKDEEILIPAISEVVRNIDLEKGVIEVTLIEGL